MSYVFDPNALTAANARSFRKSTFAGVANGAKFAESYPIDLEGPNYLNSITLSCQAPCSATESVICRAYRYQWYYDGVSWTYTWNAPLITPITFNSSYVYNWNFDESAQITLNNQPLWNDQVVGSTQRRNFLVLAFEYLRTSGTSRLKDLLFTAYLSSTPGIRPRVFASPPSSAPANDALDQFPPA